MHRSYHSWSGERAGWLTTSVGWLKLGQLEFFQRDCGNRSSALCLDKEAMHNPQQKVTSAQWEGKNKNTAGERGSRGGGGAKIPVSFTQKCKQVDVRLMCAKALWEHAGDRGVLTAELTSEYLLNHKRLS